MKKKEGGRDFLKGTKHLPFFLQMAGPGRQHIFLSACLPPSQTKDALLKILEDVKQDDYLNFILFSGDVTTWKDSLVPATPENIQEARNL